MAVPVTPSDLARETIKALATRRLSPTPANYARIYREIASQSGAKPAATLEDILVDALESLPRIDGTQRRQVERWEKAVTEQRWDDFRPLLQKAIRAGGDCDSHWPETIRELLRSWDLQQEGMTTARKRVSLERLLQASADEADLADRIVRLARSWGAASVEAAPVQPGSDAVVVERPGAEIEAARQLVIRLAERVLLPALATYPDLRALAVNLIDRVGAAASSADWDAVNAAVGGLLIELERQGVAERQLQHELLRLLRLIIDNVSQVLVEDQWIRGQFAVLRSILSGDLNPRLIADAEAKLREVISKQSALKQSLVEAKQTFKQLVSSFLEQLEELSNSTGAYQGKVEHYSDEIERASDLASLNQVVSGLLADTRDMNVNLKAARDAIAGERQRVEQAEARILSLERQLEEVSEKVREDQLTGTLNRRGLDEALTREMARADRSREALALAMVDIDNFKQLNDNFGHQTGDDALRHLANVVKAALRPTDLVGRFGGEEFVIILPHTNVMEATGAMVRMQRELTKRFFLHNNERLLITFSAGVALYRHGESQVDLLMRADQAMYAAKRAGKNRVFSEMDAARHGNG